MVYGCPLANLLEKSSIEFGQHCKTPYTAVQMSTSISQTMHSNLMKDFLKKDKPVTVILDSGPFINYVDKQGGGGVPNVNGIS